MKSRERMVLRLMEISILLIVVSESFWLVAGMIYGSSSFYLKVLHFSVTFALILPVAVWLVLSRKNFRGLVADTASEREWFRSTFSAVAEGIVIQNHGGITDCNPAAERILGLTADQLKGRKSVDPRWKAIREDGSDFPGEDHPASLTLRSGEPTRNVIMGVETPDGVRRWLSVSTEPIRDGNGNFESIVVSFADVTQQRAQAKRLELIIDGAGLGTWEWDIPSGSVIYNEYWARMLGYEIHEIEPDVNAWEKLLNPDDLYRVLHSIQEHFQFKTKEYRCELHMRHKDGSWKWILATGKVTERSKEGAPLRMVGVHVDIHAIKTLQAELEVAQKQAQAASDAKSEFLANMSHEIRTPMTAILGFTDLLATEASTNKELSKKYIETIHRNGGQLLGLLNDILDLSKIEAGKMTLEIVPTNPVSLVQEVIALMQVRAAEKGLILQYLPDSSTPFEIQTDPVRLRQVLVNLIGNAIKFTEKGSVKVKSYFDPAKQFLHFAILDTGIGLTPQQKEQLFGAFVQADTSMTRRFGGTGLGLSISNRLAKMLGGSIQVQSVPGHGSIFELSLNCEQFGRVFLPVTATTDSSDADAKNALSNSTPSASTAIQQPLLGMKILFAEDGPDNQKLISHLLSKAGAAVQIVDNGKQAVEALTRGNTLDGELLDPSPFDILLSDMQMPEMDGYAAVKLLRSKGCRMPIIALTAHAMKSDLNECLAAGCDDYASKPIGKAKLIETCLKWANADCEKAAVPS